MKFIIHMHVKKNQPILVWICPLDHLLEALNKLNWKTLARRRAEHRATFIYKCLNNLFSHHFNIEFNKDRHDYNTRCKNNIRKSASNRNWGHWTLTNFVSNDWNKLDLSIRQSPSLASFKRVLRNVNSF